MGKYTKIIVLLIIPFFTMVWGSFLAQDDEEPMLLFSGKILNSSKGKVSGVEVEFMQDGSLFQTVTTASSGKYPQVKAPYGHIYKVKFSKEGYVSKSVIIDAKKGYFKEDISEMETNFNEMGTTLIKEQPDVDYSVITSRPVAKAHIDPSTGNMNFDFNYINMRSKEIQKFMEELANKDNENAQKFLQLVKEGDKAFSSGQYDNAIKKYEEAIKIKADEDVDSKIADAENKLEELEELKKLDEEFNKTIQKGDQLLASNDFDNAIAEYNKAKGLKPGDKLPDEKINAANDKRNQADASAMDKQYNDKMAEAVSQFNIKKLSEAKGLYQEALQLKPKERDPKDKIAEIDAIIKMEEDLERNYAALIEEGNNAMTTEKYDDAILKFEEALKLKSDEKYPKDELAKAKELKAKFEESANKQKKYDDLISKANSEMGSEKWEQAKLTYNEALGVLSDEQLPKDKIAEIDAKLKELAEAEADKAAQQKKYDDLISKANSEMGSEKWEQAKSTYGEALGVLSDEQLPKDKITEIDAKLKELADAEANKANEQKKYDDLISKANSEMGSEKWEQAKSTYNEALGVFSNEQLPKDKIAEIDVKLKELADKASQQKKYDDLISKANSEMGSEKWEQAKLTYNEALGVFSNEQLPKDKIAEIDVKLKELADKASQQKKYDDLISKANSEMGSEKWEQAKSTYNEALGVFSNEQLPKDKIAEIDAKLLEIAEAASADEKAKAEAKIKREEFDNLMSSGEKQLQEDKFLEAKKSFEEASSLYPEKSEPKSKLEIVETKIKEKEELATVGNKYNGIIAKANTARDGEEWEVAKQLYKDANVVKSSENYPQEQINWINDKMKAQLEDEVNRQYQKIIDVADKLFGEEKYAKSKELFKRAKTMKSEDPYPSKKITEIEKLIAENEANLEKEKAYSYLLAQADNQFESEDWGAAKINYNKALAVIDKQYPKDQVAKIDAKINEGKKSQDQFDKLINQANSEFNAEDWVTAKNSYNSALAIFSDKPYPKKQIEIINSKLNELAASNELEQKYSDKITEANQSRDSEEWEKAKKLYIEANAIKSSESYPQEQIDWINKQMKAQLESEVKKQYQKIVDKADELLAAKQYEKSKDLFQRAKNMFSEETYPPKKIAEIIDILDKLAKKNENAAAQKVIDDKYNGIVAKGDAARDAKTWDKAKQLYKDANGVKSAESYPQEQIDWINKQMKSQLTEEVNKQYQKIIDVADKLFGEEDYLKSKKLYERAMGMKPGDSYPPVQVKKIEAALLARANKDKTNGLYSSYIKEGNGQFDDEKYRSALKSFHSALEVKPSAPYPKKKIDEINAILDELAAKKAEKSRNKVPDFVENPYGDEVTGKYTEDDVNLIMTNGKINDNNINDKIIRDRKDAEASTLKNNADLQHNIGDKNYAANEEMETQIAEFTKDADIQRENNVEDMEGYKERNNDILGSRIDVGRNVTYDNELANEAMETRITEFTIDSDIQRQDNVKSMEEYKQVDYTEGKNRLDFGTDRTYDNELANETMETRITEFTIDSDIQRQDNVKSMEEYKQVDYTAGEDRLDFGMDRTYDNELANETMETRITEFTIDSDIQRQDNVKSMEEYKQVDYTEGKDRLDFGTDRTYDNELANETMETRITEFTIDSDIQRQDNVKSMEEYKQVDYAAGEDRLDFGTDRTYDNELANETMETRITEFTIDSDIQRQDNVKNMEHYQEKEWAVRDIRIETSSDKNHNTFEENEDLVTKRAKEMVDADNSRERNADELGNYQDKLKDLSAEYYENDKNVGFNNANEMDRVKNQSATIFSDENQQKLAAQYPEGITEKMFERRNGRGEVIEVTILRVVVVGIKGDEYKKVAAKWGTTYFKNGGVISEYIWDTETN